MKKAITIAAGALIMLAACTEPVKPEGGTTPPPTNIGEPQFPPCLPGVDQPCVSISATSIAG